MLFELLLLSRQLNNIDVMHQKVIASVYLRYRVKSIPRNYKHISLSYS